MVEEVRTVTIEGKVHTLPDGVDVQVRFSDGYGSLHETPESAAKSKAIKDVEAMLQEAIDWRDEELDVQWVVDNRAQLIDALQRIGTDA